MILQKPLVSKFEHRLLLLATSLIPLLIIGAIIVGIFGLIYNTIFPPPAPSFTVTSCDLQARYQIEFRIFGILSIFFACACLYYRQVFLASITYLTPLFFAGCWLFLTLENFWQRILFYAESHPKEIPPIYQLFFARAEFEDMLLISFITFLFLWQTKILIFDLIQNRAKLTKLS